LDSLSHAIIGVAVANLAGAPISPYDPIYIATILGAQAPDFDAIALVRSQLSFLEQHRSLSHSIPGVAIWSTLITVLLWTVLPLAAPWTLFGWAFAGGLSHIAIDYFNTHGASLLWPLRSERKSCHLLNVFDPVLIVLMLGTYLLPLPPTQLAFTTFAVIFFYIFGRAFLRNRATYWLKLHFQDYNVVSVLVMPSLKRIFFWDFVVETSSNYLIGQIGALCPVLEVRADLPQPAPTSITAQAQNTELGKFFCRFSPIPYFQEFQQTGLTQVRIYDLRYFRNKNFVHRAIITFDPLLRPIESQICSLGHIIKVPC
jgi:inner membrane protein